MNPMENGPLYPNPLFRTAGDTGLLVEFGQAIDPEVNTRVRSLARALEQKKQPGILEIIPTYRSVLIHYDPSTIRPDQLKQTVSDMFSARQDEDELPARVVKIPVCYGGEFGPDLDNVSLVSGLSHEEIIERHTKPSYLIYMVGFTPGFPFLGGLDPRLATPRLATPRMKVPKGSVGIANTQTGVYPIASPGGWQIIGQTPLTLFNPRKKSPFLYRAGDRIEFYAISPEQFSRIKHEEDLS